MAASFEDSVFGKTPLSKYRDWQKVSRRIAEEDADLHARFFSGDPLDDRVFLNYFSNWFDIRAKWWMKCHSGSYEKAKDYEEALADMSKAVLSWADEKCPVTILKRLRPVLVVRIAQRSAHWTHQALRLAREAEEKTSKPDQDAPKPTAVEPVGGKTAEPTQPVEAPSQTGAAQEPQGDLARFDIAAQDLGGASGGRRKAVRAFLDYCNDSQEIQLGQHHIWKATGYKSPSTFQAWLRADGRPRESADCAHRFSEVLRLSPEEFVRRLRKRGILSDHEPARSSSL